MKSRKKFKHDPTRKLENKVLKAIEAANLEKWRKAHFLMMDGYTQGQDCRAMLVTLSDVLATAMKSIDGWEDPDGIGDVMVEAIDSITEMASAGFVWNVDAVPVIKESIGYALQITNGMPVVEIAKSAHWARRAVAAIKAM